MSSAHLDVRSLLHLLGIHWKLWLTPTAVIAVAVAIYAATCKETWDASQAIIVRNEVSSGEKGLGRFSHPEEMKNVQETTLELLRSRCVLEAALRDVGPDADCERSEAWPTETDVVALRRNVKLTAPKGAEFGKTEVFYLNVRSHDRARSIALCEAIFSHLVTESQSIRDLKAQSMISELQKTVQVAKNDLDAATAALTATEKGVGSDLAELRAMQDTTSSDSALRRSAEDIRAQLRENAGAEKANEELLTVLEAAQKDPGALVATPNRLLESQPSLKRLKDGLTDAQLRSATLMGTMSAEHPQVKAARETEQEIGQHLHNELALAIRGVKLELRLNGERRGLLNDQLAKSVERLNSLGAVRAAYANEVAEVKNRSSLLERAEQNLSEARSAQASAKAGSLISRIDAPDTGIRPVGPSRLTIALAGALGGLLVGFGLVFLCVPMDLATKGVAVAQASAAEGIAAQPANAPVAEPVNGGSNGERLTVKEALQKLAVNRVSRYGA